MEARVRLQSAMDRLYRARTTGDRAMIANELTALISNYLNITDSFETQVPQDQRRKLPDGLPGRRLDELTDEALECFNLLLPWAAMTSDSRGRIVGSPWSSKKRSSIHYLIDPRHTAFDREIPLKDQHVFEVGCFEGIHTISCLLFGAKVTGVDGRMENVLKTLARLWVYEKSAEILLWDVERDPPSFIPPAWDILHHIGVLYHLTNPVEHLHTVLPRTGKAVLLDTHVASESSIATERYTVGVRAYRYQHYREKDVRVNPFAGMLDHAKWLYVEDLLAICQEHGFKDVRTIEDRAERNGRRVTIWAFR